MKHLRLHFKKKSGVVEGMKPVERMAGEETGEEKEGELCELLSRHPAGGDCRPPFFFSSVLEHIFSRF